MRGKNNQKASCIVRPQSVNCLVHVSFAIKNAAGGLAEAKNFGFFEKKTHIASRLPNMFC